MFDTVIINCCLNWRWSKIRSSQYSRNISISCIISKVQMPNYSYIFHCERLLPNLFKTIFSALKNRQKQPPWGIKIFSFNGKTLIIIFYVIIYAWHTGLKLTMVGFSRRRNAIPACGTIGTETHTTDYIKPCAWN